MKKLPLLLLLILLVPSALFSQSSNDVKTSGSLSPDKVKKGRAVQGTVVMEIPNGLHVQSNKPLDRFLVATKLDIQAPAGMRVGPVLFPRAVMRNLKFSKDQVAVFEGRTVIRFSLSVPANYSGGSSEIKGNLRFQACNDDACFPPVTREVKMWLNVE
jgi:hypothetical protein